MLHPHTAFDAGEAQILTALCEGLFVYDPYTLQPVPALAEKHSVSGGRTWRFTIRKEAKFENGKPITAQTFVDSWLNLLNPAGNHPYASLLDCIDGAADYRNGKLKNKNQVGIKAESGQVLLVYTNTEIEHLPNILCHHAFSAVEHSQLNDALKFSKVEKIEKLRDSFKPVSSGAYKIKKFSQKELILVKNENYWDKENVRIPQINLFLDLSKEDAVEKFNKGEMDWLSRSDVISKIGDQRCVNIDPLFATDYFFFKASSPNMQNSEFRKALLLAIPYEELRKGYPIKAETLIFPLAGYPKVQGINEYNLQKAQEIVKKLNLKESQKKLVIKIPEDTYNQELAEILKAAWSRIGIKADIKPIPLAGYYNSLKSNDYDLGIITWIGDFADPLAFLEMFRPASNLNDSGWKNAEFEKIILKSHSEKDFKKRYEMLSKAEELLLGESVIIPISYRLSVNIIDIYSIGGWYSNAIDIHPFKFIKFIEPRPVPGLVKLNK
ncbi:peptide ABC transporter substrate-binding protein [Treponema sp. OMZ 791]|uniref:peptide ABC transporter substrate-binding protein n=1 Tax=unclassified Treponema TaxID=2638727 RepID=UPI0021FB9677|nr:peptide ABC transporter substrate-binding protein [Treponema sp. OMZ 789]UTC71160.1 peptide ABC transporter substrate-binding protein [Treponema sp. OMZ 790]UTC73872.1 peptide ABC transporter substrate-binding protein [Treponema sp. OMZ 791]